MLNGLDIFLLGVLGTNFAWMGREHLKRLVRRELRTRIGNQPADDQLILGEPAVPSPPPLSWRAPDPTGFDQGPVKDGLALPHESRLPHLAEVMTDPERFAERDLILHVKIGIDNYYNYHYSKLARTFYSFSIKAVNEGSYLSTHVYMPRGEEAERLRRLILDSCVEPGKHSKDYETFIKIFIHADRITWKHMIHPMGELLAFAATREEIINHEHRPVLPPVLPEETVQPDIFSLCAPVKDHGTKSKADFFAPHRPAYPTLLHIKTDMATYADQTIVIPARLSAGGCFSSFEEDLGQSYFCLRIEDETDSGYMYLKKSPDADRFRDNLILTQKNELEAFVKITLPRYLNLYVIVFLKGELLAIGESPEEMQGLTVARTLFESSTDNHTANGEDDSSALFLPQVRKVIRRVKADEH